MVKEIVMRLLQKTQPTRLIFNLYWFGSMLTFSAVPKGAV